MFKVNFEDGLLPPNCFLSVASLEAHIQWCSLMKYGTSIKNFSFKIAALNIFAKFQVCQWMVCDYLGMLLSHIQNFIWQANHMPTLLQVYSIILGKKFICNFTSSWVFILRNSLYYLAFGSKYISVSNTQNHLHPANMKQQSRYNISQNMLEHNKK